MKMAHSILILSLAFVLGCSNARTAGYSTDVKRMPCIKSASFVSQDTVILLTRNRELVRTDDCGKTWNKIAVEPARNFEDVFFINSLKGWAFDTRGMILQSTDGGSSWQVIANLGSADLINGKLLFSNTTHGWLISSFSVLRTTDSGKNWRHTEFPEDPKALGFSFVNSQVGWLCGQAGVFNKTTDGGGSWQTSEPVGTNVDLSVVFFLDNHTGWMCTAPNSKVYSTDDGGNKWRQQNLPTLTSYLRSIHFISKSEGWAVGSDWTTKDKKTSGVVFHTTDGGRSWRNVDSGEGESFFDRVWFADSQQGWILGHDKVYRTESGGKAWSIALTITDQ